MASRKILSLCSTVTYAAAEVRVIYSRIVLKLLLQIDKQVYKFLIALHKFSDNWTLDRCIWAEE